MMNWRLMNPPNHSWQLKLHDLVRQRTSWIGQSDDKCLHLSISHDVLSPFGNWISLTAFFFSSYSKTVLAKDEFNQSIHHLTPGLIDILYTTGSPILRSLIPKPPPHAPISVDLQNTDGEPPSIRIGSQLQRPCRSISTTRKLQINWHRGWRSES